MTPRSRIAPLDVVWRTCDAVPECLGVAHEPYGRCLAHLTPAQAAEFLRGLTPGQALDLRGTLVSEDLLARVLDVVERHLGRARFDRAVFTGPARFGEVVFAGDATFDHAKFDHLASFYGARFLRNVSFREARFLREFSLHDARVCGHAAFDHVTVRGDALFGAAQFGAARLGAAQFGAPPPRGTGNASSGRADNGLLPEASFQKASFQRAQFHGFAAFDAAVFHGDACFRGARFHRAVSFRGSDCGASAEFQSARFEGAAYLGPMRIVRRLSLAGVRACAPLHIDTGGCRVVLRAAAVLGRLAARLSDADVDLRDARLAGLSAVTRRSGRLRVTSLDGLDADALTLTGVDLRACGLDGLRRPEGLRLRECVFAAPPGGLGLRLGWPPVRWWSRRRVIADEHLWRGWAAHSRAEHGAVEHGAHEHSTGEHGVDEHGVAEHSAGYQGAGPAGDRAPDPARLAVLYERLRPGLDDTRVAADFAFGAMEMRRLGSPRGRGRLLLSLYWLACGYGLRAGRALGWLALVAAVAAGAVCWAAGVRPEGKPAVHRPRVAVVRPAASASRPAHGLGG
ncbi:pentapeptide repeat-containing protein [Microbispora camponoti]|uniref:Pentapeptide repeat-containing protein n=1 Tax=Microbispora bryophytorum subsp. camponoti TaxID=1677852 RepID=A0ABR8L0S9_9ACTN|nr:pentapeptide repeat-containing protein [Microbispora camponoti]MBD3142321.1 pentapeptide repeat-containing protein [Microbispora camponoti]